MTRPFPLSMEGFKPNGLFCDTVFYITCRMPKLLFLEFSVISILVASCTHRPHRPNLLSTRSTIVVSLNKDSIILAAQSRVQLTTDNLVEKYANTEPAIFNIGKFFFISSGPEEFRGISIKEIILKEYDTSVSIRENCNRLNDTLYNRYQNFLNGLSKEEDSYLLKNDSAQFEYRLFVVGNEGGLPTICDIDLDTKIESEKISVIKNDLFERSVANVGAYILCLGGEHDHAGGFIGANRFRPNSAYYIYKAICLEARNHKDVDSFVDMVIVKSDKTIWIRDYRKTMIGVEQQSQ
jgi:hypothetical protein